MNTVAIKGAVKGVSALLTVNVNRTSVASNPNKAAKAGVAIIGDAVPCSMTARKRSGERW
jgi:hypothetical protein